MRFAAIDLGTNTFDILIVDFANDSWDICFQEKQWVRLGLDFYPQKMLTERAIKDAVDCLHRFKKLCLKYGVTKPRIIGTSALRDASNRAILIEKVKYLLQWEIEVVSGEEEALIVCKGTTSLSTCPNDGLIMDIGGGSTELIRFSAHQIKYAVSLNVGVSRLLAEIGTDHVLNRIEISRIFSHFDQCLSVKIDKPVNLIGSSGPFETFYQLVNKQRLPERACLPLPTDRLEALLNDLILSTSEERMVLKHVPEFRKKYLHLAALQLKWVLFRFNIKQVYSSSLALNDGIIELQKQSEMLD